MYDKKITSPDTMKIMKLVIKYPSESYLFLKVKNLSSYVLFKRKRKKIKFQTFQIVQLNVYLFIRGHVHKLLPRKSSCSAVDSFINPEVLAVIAKLR